MKKIFHFAAYLLIVLLPVTSAAETIYDQPYMGEFPRAFRERFSASAFQQQAESGLSSIVRKSDLIILAESENVSVAPGSDDRTTIYDTNVRILKSYKGKAETAKLNLRFQTSTTGIEQSAKHLFFLKKTLSGFEVLKGSYIFPRGQGYDNHIRLFGAVDSREDLALAIVNYLAKWETSTALNELLHQEYRHGDAYTAVRLALAARPAYGGSVLKLAVQETERKRFDIYMYGLAAYGLAIEKKKANWQLMLENIPALPGYGRVSESIVFDLAANFGGRDAASVIKDIVARKPNLAVSGAFALSKIGGQDSRKIIEGWLGDPALSDREETISNGWTSQKRSFASLFNEALSRMGRQN